MSYHVRFEQEDTGPIVAVIRDLVILTFVNGLNSRQKRFCEIYASGKPAGRSYELAGYRARGDVADANASRLLGSEKVASYVQELQGESREELRMTKNDLLKWLERAIETPVSQIGPDSNLAQELTSFEDEHGKKTRIKPVCKMQAAKQLSSLCGWDAPTQHNVAYADLSSLISAGLDSEGQLPGSGPTLPE